MYLSKCLTVEVDLEETLDRTDVRASVTVRDTTFVGYGHARRRPMDENQPLIGEALATARALSDLAHQLTDAAETMIEAQHPAAPEVASI
jgi:hypothetical protein